MLVEARGPVRGRFHEQRLRADYLRRAHRPHGGVPEQLGSHVHGLVAHVHAEHAQKNRRNRIRAVPPEPAIGLGMADTVRAQRVEPGQRAVAERGIGDRTGFIAHNGIAHSYTRGRHASDSRNAILAWQAGQADLADGSQGRFALIDQNGRLEWLTADHETIPGGTGAIEVSNTNWDTDGLIGYDLWEEAYQQGLEAGYETAIEETADSGYATTLDYTPPRR